MTAFVTLSKRRLPLSPRKTANLIRWAYMVGYVNGSCTATRDMALKYLELDATPSKPRSLEE
jgi:hypothetical protein